MIFDSAGIRKALRDLGAFLVTPRKVNPFIPALVVYSVWSVGATLTNLLQVQGILEPGESRALWLALTSLSPMALVVLGSGLVLRLNIGAFWPIAYALIIFVSGFPLLVFWITHLEIPLFEICLVFLRLMIMIAISESIVSFFLEKSRQRASELETYQIDLLTNQDEFRKSVFEYLHDTVQGRLFSVGVQLTEATRELSGKNAELVELAIAEIEKIRQKDIKSIGVSLNPPIATFGLIPSLQGLLARDVAVCQGKFYDLLDPPLTKREEDLWGLGMYRIVEQAIINALVHGNATEVEVSLGRRKNSIEMKISNNGSGLRSKFLVPGHGFSVIDGWMSKLGGRWRIAEPKGRVTVTVTIP